MKKWYCSNCKVFKRFKKTQIGFMGYPDTYHCRCCGAELINAKELIEEAKINFIKEEVKIKFIREEAEKELERSKKMSRYIDKDKLIKDLKTDMWISESSLNYVLQDINEQPEADVVEVKHGFWEQGDFYDYGDVCSKCEYDSRIESCKYNYCPNCGAKMSGDY